MSVVPVVLCGGSGTRLWPLSRRDHAKQHVPLFGGESPFQRTLRRLAEVPGFGRPVVIAGQSGRFLAADQARQVGVEVELVIEPEGRDTLPAVTLGALLASRRSPDAVAFVLPSDHHIPDVPAFAAAVASAVEAAASGDLVVFGLDRRRRPPASAISGRASPVRARRGGWRRSRRNPIPAAPRR